MAELSKKGKESTSESTNHQNKNALRITAKIYPSKIPSESGNYLNLYNVKIDTSNLPYNFKDETDYFLNGLFDYSRKASSNTDVNMHQFFKNYKKDIEFFIPIPHELFEKAEKEQKEQDTNVKNVKGGKKNMNKKSKRINRTNKKTRKYRSH